MKWPPVFVLGSLIPLVALTHKVLSWQDADPTSSGSNPSPTRPFNQYGQYRPREPDPPPRFDYVPPEPTYGYGYGDYRYTDPVLESQRQFDSLPQESPIRHGYVSPLPDSERSRAWPRQVQGHTGALYPLDEFPGGSFRSYERGRGGRLGYGGHRVREPDMGLPSQQGPYGSRGWDEPDAPVYRFRGDEESAFGYPGQSRWGRSGYRFRPLTSTEKERFRDRATPPHFRSSGSHVERRSPPLPDQGAYGYEPDS